jgi:hypothetical protein
VNVLNGYTLTAAAVLLAAAYLAACRRWPYGDCLRCHGTGELHAPLIGGYRLCPRCRATGRRVRLGRRLTPGWRELQPGHAQGAKP